MSKEVWISTELFKKNNTRECFVWIMNEADHVEMVKYHPPHFINVFIIPDILIKAVAHIITPVPPKPLDLLVDD